MNVTHHEVGFRDRALHWPTLYTLILPVALLLGLGVGGWMTADSEGAAFGSSTAVALLVWVVSATLVFGKVFGARFIFLMSMLLVLRMGIQVAHFEYVFAPLAGVTSSADLSQANFGGDLEAQQSAAQLFQAEVQESGWTFAIFGDYYRDFNNPGVPILIGTLFEAFGSFGLVVVPWTSLCAALGSLLFASAAIATGSSVAVGRTVALLVFAMPGFLVVPILYRDLYMLFLLGLAAYTAVSVGFKNVLWLVPPVALQTFVLGSMRYAYALVPAFFLVIAIILRPRAEGGLKKVNDRAVFVVVALAVLGVTVYRFSGDVLLSARRAPETIGSRGMFDALLSMGPILAYPLGAIFALLTPMPWWQEVEPSLLSYQVFSYAQSWYGLMFIVSLATAVWDMGPSGVARAEGSGGKEQLNVMLAFYAIPFALALVGALALQPNYFQIALPFLICSAPPTLVRYWKPAIVGSGLIIGLAHLALLVK